ncbi:uncharacterized protein TRAVEDRAFT_132641 [Trametes versicolor FP-101664 SS1]|uniref:uncharacterized protein n=1 Tax=Trametes versicolor (strain FP-101664) TaxID=717944 RepID=UPI0004622016|nr:uncharacterized protein TRAVEDRAFT_132641 [Trametes versicolor FP-101664 SS1]EIW54546.1 hypothetical protein TRAVEDRAFT_132641 [Trametes versicolor FP-101664 SS1]
MLRQFDVPKAKATENIDKQDRELYELAADSKEAENEAQDAADVPDDTGDTFNPLSALHADDEDGWVDEIAAMTDAKRLQFQERMRPVRMTLTKIRRLAFKIVNSSTILLPAWKKRVAEAGLPERVMPRDVSTHWNSTYDMLIFAIKYCVVVDTVCADRELGLRKFELTTREWEIVSQLADTLKV